MERSFRILDSVLHWSLAGLMAGMLVIIAAQVFYRFVLNDPLSWSEEAGRYLFVWLSFLGAAVGLREGMHLGVDLLEKALPFRVYKWVALLGQLLIQVFLCYVILYGLRVISVVRFQTSPSMGISMLYPYLAVPVGAALMLIYSLRCSWNTITASAPVESAS